MILTVAYGDDAGTLPPEGAVAELDAVGSIDGAVDAVPSCATGTWEGAIR